MATIEPSNKALQEALALSEEVLRNIELSELPLVAICLKASRLARLTNDFEMQQLFEYEASGYPTSPDGVPGDVFALGGKARRHTTTKDEKTGSLQTTMYLASIGELEGQLAASQAALSAAVDPDVSVSSANPNQYVLGPTGNSIERTNRLSNISDITRKLARARAVIHGYITDKHYELRYSRISSDVFSRIRETVDGKIGSSIPNSVKKFTAVYENLASNNPEDWANAVHSCRRILQDLADVLFPAQEDRIVKEGGKDKTIRLGPDNFINRLIAYVSDHSKSKTYESVVGSQLGFLGNRLDALFDAAQKGSHSVVTREEADRCVVYTYLVVGDLLSLLDQSVDAGTKTGGEVLTETEADTGRIEVVEFSETPARKTKLTRKTRR